MEAEFEIGEVAPRHGAAATAEIRALLHSRDLCLDDGIEIFLVIRTRGIIVACAGLQGKVVKCVAIAREMEGRNLLLPLMSEMTYLAFEHDQSHLFLYTKPEYAEQFQDCGFHLLVTVPDRAVLMENTPVGLPGYAARLARHRVDAPRVGSAVLNANPFTRGHEYLLRTAAAQCDILHVFVVGEDASTFSYADRLSLVRAGVSRLPEAERIQVHEGSDYLVSKATFPSYFLKDSGVVDETSTAIDLLVFREYIAPALGITHRFVGTEPFCPVTRAYNAAMHRWLEDSPSRATRVQVVEVPRLDVDDTAISATAVRRHYADGNIAALADLVPPATLELLTTRIRERTPILKT